MTTGKATISKDKEYRYVLEREFLNGPGRKRILYIMLNPSTADASEDDPTIRRCIGFARRERAKSMGVVNLYALRATDPSKLAEHPEPVGRSNNMAIIKAVEHHDKVVVAWGASAAQHGPDWAYRVTNVLKIIEMAGKKPLCLGITKDGHPRHPLYVKGTAQLVPFTPPLYP